MNQQKVVIITGASSGFGRLTALEAARRGYRIVVTARRSERLQELVDEIEGSDGVVLAIPGDIADAAVQQRVIDRTLARFGRIDVLVNNAGMPLPGRFVDSSLAELRGQWETNTTTVITLTKRALPALIGSGGTVINISSSIARFSVPGWGLYAASKAAVSSVSDVLRRELAPVGVAVCTVEPGTY
jgi:NADP-dependent 3-hydroxy acid dehydrogenase YdfG